MTLSNLLANDSDPDGDPLTIVSITQPTNGTATIQGSQIEYTPNGGVASDSQGGIFVKNWGFAAAGNSQAAIDLTAYAIGKNKDQAALAVNEFPYLMIPTKANTIVDQAGTGYDFAFSDLTDQAGIAGQSVANPASIFWNHVFVRLDLDGVDSDGDGELEYEYFDPSYGVKYAKFYDFEANIDGFNLQGGMPVKESVIGDLNGDGTLEVKTGVWVNLVKKNDPEVEEIYEIVSDY